MRKKKIGGWDIVLMTILSVWALAILLPVINVIAVSFTSNKEYLARPMMLFPLEPTLKNYIDLLQDKRILIGYRTTLLLVLIGVPLNLFLTTSFAYGLSRRGYPGRKLIFYVVLITMLFNGGIVPTYLVVKQLGVLDTFAALIIPQAISAYNTIILITSFRGIPKEYEDAAKVDGASQFKILYKIMIPLNKPSLVVILLFYAVFRWNTWFDALIYTNSKDLQTVQLFVKNVIEQGTNAIANGAVAGRSPTTAVKSATVIIAIMPILVVYPFVQKYFVKGVMIGGIKG